MKLEELARQSADAARVSVVRLDPPPIGARPHRPRWQTPVLVGATALVLVLGLGAWFLSSGSGDGDDGESVVASTQEVPRLGLPTLSAWIVSAAMDLAEVTADAGSGQRQFAYYGTSGASDPYEAGDLLVVTVPDTSITDMADPGATELAVRGTTAFVTEQTDSPGGALLPDEMRFLQWVEPASAPADRGVGIALASRSLTIDELVALADELVVEADGLTGTVVALPDSFELEQIASGGNAPFQPSQRGVGWLVAYELASTDMMSSLMLTTAPGDLDGIAAELRFWASDFRTVSVDGRDAAQVTSDLSVDDQPATFLRTVAWSPESGIVATLTYTGPEPDFDVVSGAETAVELDDEAWEQYQLLAQQPGPSDAAFDDVFGEGEGVIGQTTYAWTIGLQGDAFCIDLRTGDSGTGSCQPFGQIMVEPGTARTIDNGFGDAIAQVVMAAAPDVEAIRETSGVGSVERVDTTEISWFVYVGDTAHQPSFDVIVDGQVVDTLEAAAEAIAMEESSLDVANNPSAQAMGIVDDFEAIGSGGDARVQWVLGQVGTDLCIVTDGESVSAGCFPAAEITVFRPQALADGTERSYVVATNAPSCLEVTAVAPLDTVDTVGVTGISTGDGDVVVVLIIEGQLEDRELVLSDNQDGVYYVDVPDVEGSAGVNNTGEQSVWPLDACESL